MGHRVLSFQFDEDGDFADAVTSATYNYTTNVLVVEAASLPVADLPNVVQAIDELVSQDPGDGTIFTQNTTAGGVTVVYNPAATPATVKVGAASVWPVAKAQSFVAAIS